MKLAISKVLIGWIRSLPIAKWLKPIWKGILIEAAPVLLDDLKQKVKDTLNSHGRSLKTSLPAVNKAIDEKQAAFRALVKSSPVPDYVEDRLLAIEERMIDSLQEGVERIFNADEPAGVFYKRIDSLFEVYGQQMINQIKAL